jgi:uncharacterized protein (UPF0261 family)
MSKKVVVVGTFDTKATEYKFVIDLIKSRGYQAITINTGVLGFTDLFHIDIPSELVAKEGGTDIDTLRRANDRGKAIAAMSDGVSKVVVDLFEREKPDGIIGMGGTAGTHMVTSAMRTLPFGLPKICVSTVASGDVSPYLGTSDIIMIPSLTDISGINSLSRVFLTNAVGALSGILEISKEVDAEKPIIAASMFGNTTPCIDMLRNLSTAFSANIESLIFASISSISIPDLSLLFNPSRKALSAEGSQKIWGSFLSFIASSIENPFNGTINAISPFASFAFCANISPNFLFSSTVVLIKVTLGFH